MRKRLHGFFLWRARHLDGVLLAFSPVLAILVAQAGFPLAVAVASIGVWLVIGRHGSARLWDRSLAVPSILLGLYALVSWMIELLVFPQPWIDTCGSYHIYFLFLSFLPVGLVLVREPVTALIQGSRATVAVLALAGAASLALSSERMTLGVNPIIAAYAALLAACVARFRLGPDDWSRKLWFYAGTIPVAATGTRTALLFFALAAAADLAALLLRGTKPGKAVLLALALGIPAVTAASMTPVVQQRISQTISDARLIMEGGRGQEMRGPIWRIGAGLVVSAPLFGNGQCHATQALNAGLKAQGLDLKFRHFHSMYLDIVAFHGVIGSTLLAWTAFVLFRLMTADDERTGWNNDIRLLFLAIAVFGLTGSFITDERMIAATFLVFAAVLNARRRQVLLRRLEV